MASKNHREPKEGEETIKGSAPFRKVYYLMWEDRELRRLSHIEKVTWLICLTGSHTTMLPGLASVSVMRLADQVGASVAATNKALKQLEALGWIEFDRNMEVLRVVNAFKYNVPSNGDMVRGWIREWLRIPACELRAKHLEAFKHVIAGSPTLVAIINEEIALGRFENRDKVRAYQRPAAGKPQDSQDTVSTPSQDGAWTVSTSGSRKQEEGSSKASSLPTVETRQTTLCDPPAAVAVTDDDFGPAPVAQTQPPAAVATTPDRKPRQPKLVLSGEAPSSRKPANPEHAQIVADMGRWLDRYRTMRDDPKATVPFHAFAQAWKARGIDDLMLALDGLRDDGFAKTTGAQAHLAETMVAKGLGIARNGRPVQNHAEGTLQIARAMVGAVRDWTPPEDY